MTEPSDAELIRASRRQRGTGVPRSELRLWLDAHMDDLLASPPDWAALVERLNGRGMRDAFGRKLKAHSVARMFSRAKAERGGSKPATRVPSRAIAPEPAAEPFQIRSINKETP